MAAVRFNGAHADHTAEMAAIMDRLRATIAQLSPAHEEWARDLLAYLDEESQDDARRAVTRREWPRRDSPPVNRRAA